MGKYTLSALLDNWNGKEMLDWSLLFHRNFIKAFSWKD